MALAPYDYRRALTALAAGVAGPVITDYFRSRRRSAPEGDSNIRLRKRPRYAASAASSSRAVRSGVSRSGRRRSTVRRQSSKRSRRGSRRGSRRRKRNVGRLRTKLTSLLAAHDRQEYTYVDRQVASGSVAAGVHPGKWIFAGQSVSPSAVQTCGDFAHLLDIAVAISGAGPVTSIQYTLSSAKAFDVLTNMTTYPVYVKSFYCRPRADIPSSDGVTPTLNQNPFYIVGQGFFLTNNGNTPDSANTKIFDKDWDLFMSPTFCEMFKILRVVKGWVAPGARRLCTSVSKPRTVKPAKYVEPTIATPNWANAPRPYAYVKEERFWLHQFSSGIGHATAGTTGVAVAPAAMQIESHYRYTYEYITDNRVVTQQSVVGLVADSTTKGIVGPYTVATQLTA